MLISIFSTLNFRDVSSLKILYQQPSLIILPTVTYFTFSRHNIGCCGGNNRVSFSKKFTWINILASTVGYVVWGLWLFSNFDWFLTLHLDWHLVGTYLSIHLAVLVSSILLTALFLHTDKLCCCCCNPREQLSVYHPDLDKRFILVNGEVVEDVETPREEFVKLEICIIHLLKGSKVSSQFHMTG